MIQLKSFTPYVYFLVQYSGFRSLHTLNSMCLESFSLLFLNYLSKMVSFLEFKNSRLEFDFAFPVFSLVCSIDHFNTCCCLFWDISNFIGGQSFQLHYTLALFKMPLTCVPSVLACQSPFL